MKVVITPQISIFNPLVVTIKIHNREELDLFRIALHKAECRSTKEEGEKVFQPIIEKLRNYL